MGMIDEQFLNSTFDIGQEETEELRTPDIYQEKNIKENDPEQIIQKNIERANGILDHLEKNINIVIADPKILDGTASLIKNITDAALAMNSIGTANFDMEIKDKTVVLKEREMKIKEALASKKIESLPDGQKNGGTTINNTIITTSDKIMEIIRNKNGFKSEDQPALDV